MTLARIALQGNSVGTKYFRLIKGWMLHLETDHINLAKLYINVADITLWTKQYYIIATNGGLPVLTSEKTKTNIKPTYLMLNQEDLRSVVEPCSVGVESHRPSLYIPAKPVLRAMSTWCLSWTKTLKQQFCRNADVTIVMISSNDCVTSAWRRVHRQQDDCFNPAVMLRLTSSIVLAAERCTILK